MQGKHHSPTLRRSWLKHGAAAFVFEVLEFVEEKRRLIEREQHWIDVLNSACPLTGFNVAPKAGSPLGTKRSKVIPKSAEHRAKLSLAKKGKSVRHTEEGKRNIGAAAARKNQTPEMRAKVRASKLRLYSSPERLSQLREMGLRGALTIGAINKGTKRGPLSEEVRAKMSVAAKTRMARTPRGQDGRLYPS